MVLSLIVTLPPAATDAAFLNAFRDALDPPPSTAARNATSLFNAVVDTFACDVHPNEWVRQVWSLDMDTLMQEPLSLVLGVYAYTRNGHAMTSLAACEVLNGWSFR